MKIQEHLKKDYWQRIIAPDSTLRSYGHGRLAGNYRDGFLGGDGIKVLNLTQEDFLMEASPAAHAINSRYLSTRPIYECVKDEHGKEEWKITGYDDLETRALGLQWTIAMKKASHFAANGFWICNETKEEALFETLMSYKDSVGLNTAYLEAVQSCFLTGDAAIYIYQSESGIEYEVFSRLKGDTLYPEIDENGDEVIYRSYKLKGKNAVDIFKKDSIETWIMTDSDEEKSKSFFKKWRYLGKNDSNATRSEDGYIRIRTKSAQAGNLNQCIYFRVNDIPSGNVQLSIENFENSLSYVANEVKDSAFPILFLKSKGVTTLPPTELNGKTIGATGDTETLKASDAKFLAPPDASNIANIDLEAEWDNITRTSMSVFIEPEILKSGADSSTTIKILFTPEIQWCQNMWPQFAKPTRRLVEVFKRLVGKVEGQITEFGKLRVSVGLEVYIPQNEKEKVEIETTQVYARIKSRKAAMMDVGNQHIGDYEQIQKEWEEELDIKSRVPAKAKAEISAEFKTEPTDDGVQEEDDTDPNKPKIDNNDKGKTIAER